MDNLESILNNMTTVNSAYLIISYIQRTEEGITIRLSINIMQQVERRDYNQTFSFGIRSCSNLF